MSSCTGHVLGRFMNQALEPMSGGRYLRDLTRRAEKGEFSLGPMLMALLRANGSQINLAG